MTIRTYKVTLDSKNTIAPEPVFLRQGDKTGAVVIDATLMDNGSPVSLSGITPLFMANTADGKALISDTSGFNIVNAAGGKFTYQVPSQLGSVDGKIKIAYFSFSDSSGAQSTFNVVFVVEKAADMTQESAKDWVSNLNDIISQYNQWVNNAHSSWQDFVNENKEIIESIDPGGTLLAEVIAARNGKIDLKTRLDDEHAQVTEQLAEKANKDYVDQIMSALSNGGPDEIFYSIAALNTAYPNGANRTKLVFDSSFTGGAHSMIWNGSSWQDVGVFQGVGIPDGTVSEKHLNAKLKGKLFMFRTKAYKNNIAYAQAYNTGVLSSVTQCLVTYYDVTNDDIVYIKKTTPLYTDHYALLDSQGNTLSYLRNLTVDNAQYEAYLDCSVATTLAITQYNAQSNINMGEDSDIVKGYSPSYANAIDVVLNSNTISKDTAYMTSQSAVVPVFNFLYYEFDVTNYKQIHLKVNETVAGSENASLYVLYDSTGAVVRKKSYTPTVNIDTELCCDGISKIGITLHVNDASSLSVVAMSSDALYELNKRVNIITDTSYWKGKKIVWFGTSIPAGGLSGLTSVLQYPALVGQILGATVYNEAVGSSSAHCKDPSRINANNPYGFNHAWDLTSRCLSNTLAEMEYIINNFNNTNIFDYHTVPSLSDDDKNFIRDCSYERKLAKYLTGGSVGQCDLYVFNHGFNDIISDTQEALYDAKESLPETSSDTGFYNNGTYVPGSVEQSKHYDLTNVKAVVISGTFSQYYDYYDLFDGVGNNLKHLRNESVNKQVSITLDVTGATELVVSNNRSNMATVTVEKLTYGMPGENLYCYRGAMDFLINKIKEDNPRARIIMIGEYENQKYPKISEYQQVVANDWSIPLYKQWEKLGWSQKTVKTTGYWNNGVWVPSGGTEQEISYLDLWLADGIHPHSDLSGKAINFMANNMAVWMHNHVRL